MRKPKIFACGALFPLSFGLLTSYKSQKNRLRRCDVSFVHLYKRSVDKQKLRKLERAAGELFGLCSGPVTSQGSARRSHTPSVEFRIGGRRLAVVQDLRFVRDWICLLERISRTPSEPLHSELMFLSRLRRLWKYNHVLPPCAPPSRPKPQNILCFFPGSPRSQNILCFFSELYCCFPLLSSLFFPPFALSFLLLFCSFPLFSPSTARHFFIW